MRYEEATLVRVFLGEDDKHEGRPTYRFITELCHEKGIAGVTVFRGIMGYGRSSVLHEAGVFKISSDLPVVVEIIDKEEKIEKILPQIADILDGGLITLEKVKVLRYN